MLKRVSMFLGMVAVLVWGQASLASDLEKAPQYSSNPLVAVVDGQPVWMDDLKNATIQEIMVQLHTMQKIRLKQKAIEILQKNHPELRTENVKPVSKEDIRQFYETEPGIRDIGELDQIEDQIRMYLEKIRTQAALKNLDKQFELAVSKGWVVDYLTPPNDFRVTAELGTAMLWFQDQDKARKVFLLEFSDFLCPFCKKVQTTLSDLRKRYAKEVQFGYRHFPLHEEARQMAEAVECAREQGRFWQYQSMIYKYPEAHKSVTQLIKSARAVGIKNIEAFENCVNRNKYRGRVKRDFQDALNLGIQGTPTFIIGFYHPGSSSVQGEILSGAVSKEKFVSVIEKYLALDEQEKEACANC